jgi:hypothetical protein
MSLDKIEEKIKLAEDELANLKLKETGAELNDPGTISLQNRIISLQNRIISLENILTKYLEEKNILLAQLAGTKLLLQQ